MKKPDFSDYLKLLMLLESSKMTKMTTAKTKKKPVTSFKTGKGFEA